MATLYSKQFNRLVLHIPRTGGNGRNGLCKYGFAQIPLKNQHVRLCDIDKVWKGHSWRDVEEVIVVIRHPAERELSRWAFAAIQQTQVRDDQRDHRYWLAKYDTVNDAMADWRCTVLNWYQRRDHPEWYPNCQQGISLADLENIGAYRYWVLVNGQIPASVRIVRLEDQTEVFSQLIGKQITLRRTNTCVHDSWQEAFTGRGLAIVKRLYWWTIEQGYYSFQELSA